MLVALGATLRMPAFENLNFLLQGLVVPQQEGGGCGGGPHRSCRSRTITVLFRGNDSVSLETFKRRFQFSLFLPFKIPFYFIITIFFLPREEQRKEERRKLIKQSPNAKHLAVSLWILTVAPALTSWGLLLRRSGGEPSSQRAEWLA